MESLKQETCHTTHKKTQKKVAENGHQVGFKVTKGQLLISPSRVGGELTPVNQSGHEDLSPSRRDICLS